MHEIENRLENALRKVIPANNNIKQFPIGLAVIVVLVVFLMAFFLPNVAILGSTNATITISNVSK